MSKINYDAEGFDDAFGKEKGWYDTNIAVQLADALLKIYAPIGWLKATTIMDAALKTPDQLTFTEKQIKEIELQLEAGFYMSGASEVGSPIGLVKQLKAYIAEAPEELLWYIAGNRIMINDLVERTYQVAKNVQVAQYKVSLIKDSIEKLDAELELKEAFRNDPDIALCFPELLKNN